MIWGKENIMKHCLIFLILIIGANANAGTIGDARAQQNPMEMNLESKIPDLKAAQEMVYRFKQGEFDNIKCAEGVEGYESRSIISNLVTSLSVVSTDVVDQAVNSDKQTGAKLFNEAKKLNLEAKKLLGCHSPQLLN